MTRTERAFVGFVLGGIGLAVLQNYTTRQAAALGLPHAIAGLCVAAVASELGPA
jgi:Ca2+/Na+ antiporter